MILETERLILRPFTENDFEDVFEYLHEPMVHCFEDMRTKTRDMIEAHDKVFSLIQEGLSDAGLDMDDIYTEAYRGDE